MSTARAPADLPSPSHFRALALVLVCVVGLVPPLGYLFVGHGAVAASAQTTAQIKAEIVNQMIGRSPEMWQFEGHRLNEVLNRYPMHLEDDHAQIVDAAGKLVAESDERPAALVLVRAAPLFDSGTQVGLVEVRHSLRGLLVGTAVAGLLGLALAGALFILLRRVHGRDRQLTGVILQQQERARVTLYAIDDAVITTDVSGVVIDLNLAAERLTLLNLDEARGRRSAEVCRLVDESTAAEIDSPVEKALCQLWPVLPAGCAPALLRHDGSLLAVEVAVSSMKDRRQNVVGAVLVLRDVSARRQAAQQLQWAATHDALTGLANRHQMRRELEESIKVGRRRDERLAVLFMDLDGFKGINDTLGHHQGDCLLVEIARRIQLQVREVDTVARLGGDEFCVLLRAVSDVARCAQVAQRCLDALVQPMLLGKTSVSVRCSIGIAVYPEDGMDPDDLLRAADTAMYAAKAAGKHRFALFDQRMSQQVEERMALEAALGVAIERDELELHYQPQVSLSSGRMTGVEALVRWRRPGFGLIPPDEFIGVAERIGLIGALGLWVIETACRQAVAWQARGVALQTMAVNISPSHFESPEFVESVRELLQATGLAPGCLEIEVTESVTRHPQRHADICRALQALGVRVAIDDFGTGYSSLSVLKTMPIDTLKLDRMFVLDATADASSALMIGTIIGMASALKFEVVAEGVETLEQVQILTALNCEVAQGYFFCRPVPAGQVPAQWGVDFLDPARTAASAASLP